MQVTHVADHVTHAVIGAGEAQAFAINDSVEFFRILSSSLYSDKMLAVIREVLCNAWDAHIENDCTGTAIQVSINESKLIIRDFGTGMSKANIRKLYTTYGGTTKVANEQVTGGFGLGSKAPFAYVDHFEVTSHFEDIKTIYNMSLSSAQVDGKPSVMAILDLPSSETGIQVSLNLKTPNDRYRFEELVRRIAANGQMKVELNGTEVPIFEFNQAPHGFVILPNNVAGGNSSRIYIRYGHVVYPLEKADAFDTYMERAQQFLKDINRKDHYNYDNGTNQWALVLQAPPSSVSVTPSRESLSMTDHTTTTIVNLLQKFLANTSEGMTPSCLKLVEQAIETNWVGGKPADLFVPRKVLPNKRFFAKLQGGLPKQITTVEEAAAHYMSQVNYPDNDEFYIKDIDLRLQSLITFGFGDKGLINSYRQELRKLRSLKANSTWFYRKMLWPLLRDIKEENKLKAINLMVIDLGQKRRFGSTETLVMPYGNQVIRQIRFGLPFLRKIVTISHNRVDIFGYLTEEPMMRHWMGHARGTLAYIVPRHPQRIQEARDFFKKRGYHVIDITPQQASAPIKLKDPDEVKPAPRPKLKGVPLLSNLIASDSKRIDPILAWCEDSDRTETPNFACIVSPNTENLKALGQLPHGSFEAVIRLFGNDGAVVANVVQYDKLKEKLNGSMVTIDEWVLPRLLEEFKTNKLIKQHYRNYRAQDVDIAYKNIEILSIIRRDEQLRKWAKLPVPVTGREADLIRIYESFHHHRQKHDAVVKDITALIKTWTATATLKKLLGRMDENPLIDFLDISCVGGRIRNGKPETQDKARRLLLYALKG